MTADSSTIEKFDPVDLQQLAAMSPHRLPWSST
jgi:hypothetical protein